MRLLCFLLLMGCYGCGVLPNGTSYFGEERIFGKMFNQTYPVQYREAEHRESAWELGIAIRPKKDGRIKGIRIKNPTLGYLRLSVWDADTRALIHTMNVNIDNTVEYNFAHCLIPIVANKTYCISINVLKYYYYTLPYNPLPVHSSDISLLYSVYEETPHQRFPQHTVSSVYHGIIDIDADFKIN